ncbi:MAG: SDR family NAD(P)-dependent oxidoreductase [Chloroherpetonaceae bacterium]|nr:SDR family NAD(P)-dependent oxidoreductase [Chthonomonadaceae bacterium]MDW8206879.1 SDR family NAD(P)-dependent oxidoreductase [Chloroherpetonaceae bacterium]
MVAASGKIAVVTGASSGIGAATAVALHRAGFQVVLGARRVERLQAVGEPIGARCLPLDVTDPESVRTFCAQVPEVHVLVNNAGGALGLDPIAQASDADWQRMYDTNVLGLMRMTRELLPKLEASGAGHIVNVGSVAGREPYVGGAGYNAAKFAVRAITQVLRLELVGKPIRVTEIVPGMVATEFSLVRFKGDQERADRVYAGMQPLVADDVADCIVWAVTRPPHVNIDEIVVKPLAQASVTVVARNL